MPVHPFVCLECGREFRLAMPPEGAHEAPEGERDPACPHCASTQVECLVTTCEAVAVER
jgi:DNA-directed RNA polymerase subunit RPC12/RpoP